MNNFLPVIEIFGADVICASCVNAPSSKDTYEWLEAAISRKYPNHPFIIRYINIEGSLESEREKDYATRIAEDEFFYPLVLINDEVVGEGYIHLKPVFEKLESIGFKATE